MVGSDVFKHSKSLLTTISTYVSNLVNINSAIDYIKTYTSNLVLTKTIQTELLPITAIAANAQQLSSELDISSFGGVSIFIDHARDAATAFVGAGTEYRIMVSEKATGNDTWRTVTSVVCDITAASSIVMDGQELAGSTVIETGATIPAVNDWVFFKNATLEKSEWAKVTAIVSTGGSESFTILFGLINTQAAITLYNKAELFVIPIPTTTFKRLMVCVNNNNGTTNQNIVSRIACIGVN